MSLLSSTLNIKPKRKSSKVGVASETSAGNKSLKSASRNVIKSKIDEVECNKEEEAWLDNNAKPLSMSMIHEAAGISDVSAARMTCLVLSGRNISCISSLKDCCNLRSLDLSFNRLAALDNLEYQYQLRELKLGTNQITSLAGLNRLTALEVLEVQDNRLIDLGKGCLSSQKKLKFLRVDGNKISTLANGLDPLVALTHLDAGQNLLTKIEGLGLLAQLEILSLSYNQITTIEGLGACARLKELDLTGNCVQAIQGLNKCPLLEVLRLESNQLQEVSGLSRLTALSELYVADNKIERCLHVVAACTKLEFLSISNNRLNEVADLEALSSLTGLIDLKLAGNPMCMDERYSDCVLKHLSVLDSLDDLDLRKGRPAADEAALTDADALLGYDGFGGTGENKLAQIIQQSGFATGGQAGRKELETVLTTEEFERQLREMREAILNMRRSLDQGILAYLSPKPPPLPAPPPRRPTNDRSVVERFGGEGSSYGAAEAAVAKTLERLRALREGTGYLSTQPAVARFKAPAESGPAAADTTPAVLTAALQRLDEELDRRLAATAELIREEANDSDSEDEPAAAAAPANHAELVSDFFATQLPAAPPPPLDTSAELPSALVARPTAAAPSPPAPSTPARPEAPPVPREPTQPSPPRTASTAACGRCRRSARAGSASGARRARTRPGSPSSAGPRPRAPTSARACPCRRRKSAP